MPPKNDKNNDDVPRGSGRDINRSSVGSLLDDAPEEGALTKKTVQHYKHMKYIRIAFLSAFWLCFFVLLAMTEEDQMRWYQISVRPDEAGKKFEIEAQPEDNHVTLVMRGPFLYKVTDVQQEESGSLDELHVGKRHILSVNVQRRYVDGDDNIQEEKVSETFYLALIDDDDDFDKIENFQKFRKVFELNPNSSGGTYFYQFKLKNVEVPISLLVKIYLDATRNWISVMLASLVIFVMHLMLFWDVLSRCIVGLLVSTLVIGLTGIYGTRPGLHDILKMVDIDIILLVFGVSIIVAVLFQTKADSYVAVQAFRYSNGHIWPMLTTMCFITAFGAAFISNITILMLNTSVAVRLCEIMQINLTSVLTCLMLFSNLGHMLTINYELENRVLSLTALNEENYRFSNYGMYMVQMFVPVTLSIALTYIFLRLYYRSSADMRNFESRAATRLRHAIRFWRRAAQSIGNYTQEEKAVRDTLLSKVDRLRGRLQRLGKMPVPKSDFQETVERLRSKNVIQNKILLITCCCVLLAVLLFQTTELFRLHYLSPGWICLLFALMLLALTHYHDIEALMSHIDWSTLILIACVHIITKCVEILGLFDAIGESTVNMIKSVDPSLQQYVGLIIMITITTFCAAFLDGSYVCLSMATQVIDLYHNPQINLAMEPMLLAVLLGVGLSGNATIISSMSNIVCAGIAEKHGLKFYYWEFFKIGFAVTILNLVIGIIYSLIFNIIVT